MSRRPRPSPSPHHSSVLRAAWLPGIAVSLLLLVPCYWQSRIQAGDLSSHLYNAWLATLIDAGEAPGLSLAPQFSNVLFDGMLQRLLAWFGAAAAERIAVSLAVLVFFWGAFALLRRIAGRTCWILAPCLVLFAYGWVFHMGFFNYYLAFGISCFLLAALWPGGRAAWLLAPLLAGLGWLAHPLPVACALAIAAYVHLARRLSPRAQAGLLLAAAAVIVALPFVLALRLQTSWSWRFLLFATGADQLVIFDRASWFLAGLLVLAWTVARWQQSPAWGKLPGIAWQVALLCALAAAVAPYSVGGVTGVAAHLTMIPMRLSLFPGLFILGALATAPLRRWLGFALAGLALVHLGLVYAETRELNRVEDRIGELVQAIPPGSRVLAFLPPDIAPLPPGWLGRAIRLFPDRRASPVHLIDRACIARCFHYANYEPASGQFRIRALPGNPFVTSSYPAALRMEMGLYQVTDADLPLTQIFRCGPRATDLCARPLRAGEINGQPPLPPAP